jgi:hypothetical protein
MRRTLLLVAAAALAAGFATGCASAGPDVLGRNVTLVPKEPKAPRPKGELLAADGGRVWLRTPKDGVREYEVASLREVRVQRHGYGGGRIWRIGLIGGLVSAAALTASCTSVEGNETGGCVAAGAIVGGALALVGGLSSMSLDASSQARLTPQDLGLRRYARFPAGLPEGVPPEWLMQEPKATKPDTRHLE